MPCADLMKQLPNHLWLFGSLLLCGRVKLYPMGDRRLRLQLPRSEETLFVVGQVQLYVLPPDVERFFFLSWG